MLASSWTFSWMIREASSNSSMVIDEEPEMLTSTPRAPEMSISSSSGLAIACWAASAARRSPVATPMPIIAMPRSLMIALTSAKSTLIRPLVVIRSAIPWTAWRRTSSAGLKASRMLMFLPASPSRRSFGTTIRESTTFLSSSTPWSACSERRFPSRLNGLVTTPMVNAPASLATSATIGAAPVPVPPPSPAAIKTMSAPSRFS